MLGIDLIRDLAVILLVAAATGWLCRRLGLSVVVGYLLAGMIIGPYTPPFQLVASVERVQMLADFGLVFLIFSVGMGLSLGRLQRLGFSLALATLVGALLILNLCRLLGASLGWPPTQSLFLAGMLMVSSSAIISKVLEELNATHERWGQLALGMTVLEDVVAVVMLTLLTSLASFGGQNAPSIWPTLGKLSAFVVLVVFLSVLVVPRTLRWLTREGATELRTLLLAGLVLGLAWVASRAGYSPALGAFLLGALVAGTPFRADVERSFEGVKQMFGAVFFVAIGMLFDFRLLLQAWPLVLGATAIALLARPMACAFGLLTAGNSNRESLQAGLALTPIGEFSFVIAQLGVSTGVVPASFSAVAVGVSLGTALTAPVLMRRSESVASWIESKQPQRFRDIIAYYHDWLAHLQARQGSSVLWKLTGGRLGQIAAHLLFLSALLLFWQPAYRLLAGVFGENILFPGGLRLLFWMVFGILLIGPLVALWRNVEAVTIILAEGASRESPRRRMLQPWIQRGLKGIAGLILAVWLLTLLPLGGAPTGTVLVIVGVVLIAAILFSTQLLRWHGRLEIQLRSELRSASSPAGAAGVSLPVLDQPSGWNLEIAEVTLPSQSDLAGRSIRELGLRPATGCSILTLDRGGFNRINPGPDELLYPGDRLLLLGPPDRLPQAERLLAQGLRNPSETVRFEELTSDTLVVPPGCAQAGKPLRDLRPPRDLGVLICGIQRGRDRQVLPPATASFQPGDRLLLVGATRQLEAYKAWLTEGV
ncbi:MAG: cation:proton antiporter [Verrucomicrobia bacterium]|nr:cation:proton antiporter [Verrucomicrobiota bacterium]